MMKNNKVTWIFLILFFLISGFITQLRAAEITYVEGTVQVKSTDAEEWQRADKGTMVNIGDSVRTARRSKADIALDASKKNTIRIEAKTLVVLNGTSPAMIDRIDLSSGKIYANLESLKTGLGFEVTTPSAVAGVRGSSYSVRATRDEDEIASFLDPVFLKTYDQEKNLTSELMMPEGFKTYIERFETPNVMMAISQREVERWDRIIEEVTSHSEGRERTDLRRQAEIQAREEKAKKEAEVTTEGQAADAAAQEQVIETVTETKELIEDSNVEDKIAEERGYHAS